jgi:hypothetical protein
MKRFFLLALLFTVTPAWGRVFDLQREKFSSYLIGGISQSNLKDTPMMGESTAASFSDVYSNITSGEFGVTYAKGVLGLRFGFEIIKPLNLTGNALNGAAATIYSYQTNITVMNPKIGADVNIYTGQKYRLMLYGYYGIASYSASISYSGVTIPPNADHSVEHRSSAPCYGGGIAGEIAFFDTTTFIFEAGYRQLKFVNIKYGNDVTSFQGAKVKGDAVLNEDLTNHQVDFTGVVLNAGLRFYLF